MRLRGAHRRLALAGGVAVAAVSGVAAASALTGAGPGRSAAGPYDPVPGSVRIDRRADDPSGHGPQWAVRVYEGMTGLSCLDVGRTDGRRFGPLDASGQIQDTAVTASGSCGDLTADVVQFGLRRVLTPPGAPTRSVFFGRASTAVRSIVARLHPGGEELALGAARTFLIVLDGLAPTDAVSLTATLDDASQRTISLE